VALITQGLSDMNLALFFYGLMVFATATLYPLVTLCCYPGRGLNNVNHQSGYGDEVNTEQDNASSVATNYVSQEVNHENLAITVTTPVRGRRIYFLDNLKTFLTATVVTHHVGCAFGAG